MITRIWVRKLSILDFSSFSAPVNLQIVGCYKPWFWIWLDLNIYEHLTIVPGQSPRYYTPAITFNVQVTRFSARLFNCDIKSVHVFAEFQECYIDNNCIYIMWVLLYHRATNYGEIVYVRVSNPRTLFTNNVFARRMCKLFCCWIWRIYIPVCCNWYSLSLPENGSFVNTQPGLTFVVKLAGCVLLSLPSTKKFFNNCNAKAWFDISHISNRISSLLNMLIMFCTSVKTHSPD